MTQIRIPRPRAEVVAWTDERVAAHHAVAWDAWLHGTVAVYDESGHDVLVVPMSSPSMTALHVAERLYTLGAVRRIGSTAR